MNKLLLHIILGAFVLIIGGANSNAAKLGDLKPLKKVEFAPVEEFINSTKLIEEIPYDDQFLDYSIRLPKDFELSTSKLRFNNQAENVSKKVLGVVSRYVGEPRGYVRSSFVLEALELTYEISARNWFVNYVIKNGLSLEEVGEGNDTSIEAIYIEIIKNVTYIVRIKAIKNGPRMIMARYYLPQELYEEQKAMQSQVINSFKLKNTESNEIESLQSYAFLDQSYIKFPNSWQLDAPYIRSIDRMEARIFRNVKGNRLDGQIDIYLSRKEPDKKRSSEIEYYKEKAILEGYELGAFLETKELDHSEDIKFAITEVYQLKSKRQDLLNYEMWFTLLENKEYYYFVTMYTPEKEISFAPWARNTEAYKILLKNVKRESTDDNFMQVD